MGSTPDETRGVGFTGTQDGMQFVQLKSTHELFHQLHKEYDWFEHGDCTGSDEEAHRLARSVGFKIRIRPPIIETKRAFCKKAEIVMPPKPYLDRNRDIADHCKVLVATPKGFEEELRSGTWSTIRAAKRLRRPVYIVWPDGRREKVAYD